jgi:hypothetical protein
MAPAGIVAADACWAKSPGAVIIKDIVNIPTDFFIFLPLFVIVS